jgi:hypothetical protein
MYKGFIVYFHADFTVLIGTIPKRKEFSYPKMLAPSPTICEMNGAVMPQLDIPEVSLYSMMSQWIMLKIRVFNLIGCRRM